MKHWRKTFCQSVTKTPTIRKRRKKSTRKAITIALQANAIIYNHIPYYHITKKNDPEQTFT